MTRRGTTRARILSGILAGMVMVLPATVPAHGRDTASHTPNLALSASFAPARYVVRDSVQRERLLRLLRDPAWADRATGDPDTAGTAPKVEEADAIPYFVQGNAFMFSRGWVKRLAAGEAPAAKKGTVDAGAEGGAGGPEEEWRERARARLERELGGRVDEPGPGFPAGYLPGEAAFVHQATPAEEPKAHCREKPMWPYLKTSTVCGRAVSGVDLGMERVWDRFDGADTLVIAVLDAGFDFLHPELQGRWAINEAEANGLPGVDDDGNGFVDDIRGWDFVDDDNDPQDYNGHGTMTSGVIAAGFDNGTGLPGMLPRVRILPVRVLSTAGFGATDGIAAGIRYAAARGAHVINFSIGIGASGTSTALLRSAFEVARDSGVIIAAAAGNDGLDLDVTPRQPFTYRFDNIYGVAAYDPAPVLSGYSNFGASSVDIAAPGDHIVTTGIPPALTLLREDFENFSGADWSLSDSWTTAPDPRGGKSLQWVSGNTATAILNDVDMRGKRGGLLTVRLTFQPAGVNDGLDLYVLTPTGTIPVNVITRSVDDEVISVNLGVVDETSFRLAFRACILNSRGTCSATATAAGRVLRLDDIRISHADLDPAKHDVITVTGGSSMAAPFFAGYAGLMRLATDRTGTPLTRDLVLAGARPEPWLAGKVATGGRLDVAKGLDFHLKTLPQIAVNDSGATAWKPGAAVHYALTVRDGAGPRPDFTFSPIALPPGGSLSPEGTFAWSTGGSPQGAYAVRARADNGTLTLRSLITFAVGTVAPVRPARPEQASRLRVGGQVFVLPAAGPGRDAGPRTLRLELYGADGRRLHALEGPFSLPPGVRMTDYRLDGIPGVVTGARAWLDGVPLAPARNGGAGTREGTR